MWLTPRGQSDDPRRRLGVIQTWGIGGGHLFERAEGCWARLVIQSWGYGGLWWARQSSWGGVSVGHGQWVGMCWCPLHLCLNSGSWFPSRRAPPSRRAAWTRWTSCPNWGRCGSPTLQSLEEEVWNRGIGKQPMGLWPFKNLIYKRRGCLHAFTNLITQFDCTTTLRQPHHQ